MTDTFVSLVTLFTSPTRGPEISNRNRFTRQYQKVHEENQWVYIKSWVQTRPEAVEEMAAGDPFRSDEEAQHTVLVDSIL